MKTIFRSYANLNIGTKLGERPVTPGKANNFPIWKVGRATAAAPTIFPDIEIEGNTYVDGALYENNPVNEARHEIYMKDGVKRLEICVSIGTGRSPPVRSGAKGAVTKLYHTLSMVKEKALECEKEHEHARFTFNSAEPSIPYYRLNTGVEIGKTKTGEWKAKREYKELNALQRAGYKMMGKSDRKATLDRLACDTDKELQTDEMKAHIHKCATILVKLRRDRIKDDADRWERFATCTRYACKVQSDCEQSFTLRKDLKDHLKQEHPDHWLRTKLDEYLDDCKILPQFLFGPF